MGGVRKLCRCHVSRVIGKLLLSIRGFDVGDYVNISLAVSEELAVEVWVGSRKIHQEVLWFSRQETRWLCRSGGGEKVRNSGYNLEKELRGLADQGGEWRIKGDTNVSGLSNYMGGGSIYWDWKDWNEGSVWPHCIWKMYWTSKCNLNKGAGYLNLEFGGKVRGGATDHREMIEFHISSKLTESGHGLLVVTQI